MCIFGYWASVYVFYCLKAISLKWVCYSESSKNISCYWRVCRKALNEYRIILINSFYDILGHMAYYYFCSFTMSDSFTKPCCCAEVVLCVVLPPTLTSFKIQEDSLKQQHDVTRKKHFTLYIYCCLLWLPSFVFPSINTIKTHPLYLTIWIKIKSGLMLPLFPNLSLSNHKKMNS